MVAGKDATDEYEDVGHSDEARKMLDAGGDIKVIGAIEVRPRDRLAAASPGQGRAARLAPLCDLGLVSVRRVSRLPARNLRQKAVCLLAILSIRSIQLHAPQIRIAL